MQNWEILQKKINEMNKDEFIKNMQGRSGPWLLGILSMNGKYNNKLRGMCVEDGKGCEKYKDCNECKKHFLEAEYYEPKQEKWIVHRTLRKSGRELYVENAYIDYILNNNGYLTEKGIKAEYTYDKSKLKGRPFKNTVIIRDMLNKNRVGKQYLWVISKVEE